MALPVTRFFLDSVILITLAKSYWWPQTHVVRGPATLKVPTVGEELVCPLPEATARGDSVCPAGEKAVSGWGRGALTASSGRLGCAFGA